MWSKGVTPNSVFGGCPSLKKGLEQKICLNSSTDTVLSWTPASRGRFMVVGGCVKSFMDGVEKRNVVLILFYIRKFSESILFLFRIFTFIVLSLMTTRTGYEDLIDLS